MARKDSVTLGWGGAHVCIQGTGAPDPAGGVGGVGAVSGDRRPPRLTLLWSKWDRGASVKDCTVWQRLSPPPSQPWPRPLDWVTNFTHIWASSSGHRKSVERSRLRPPLAAKAPHLSREWKA